MTGVPALKDVVDVGYTVTCLLRLLHAGFMNSATAQPSFANMTKATCTQAEFQ